MDYGGDSQGDYTIPTEEGLKEHYVVNENFTKPKFGNLIGELIAGIRDKWKNRFFEM